MSNPQSTPQVPTFLDAPALLESSRPQLRGNAPLLVLGLFATVTMVGTWSASHDATANAATQVLVGMVLVGAVGLAFGMTFYNVRRVRHQQGVVAAVEEMMQLRRWQPAGMLLNRFLQEPVRSPRLWGRALMQLGGLLNRFHRYDDAIGVFDFLTDHRLLDDSDDFTVRVARAMAMLHEDSLVDADRAINDVRRRGPVGQSGGLALLELYRDVKTGHPAEAVEGFAKRSEMMRQQLGHRMADAHALVARAYDLLDRPAEAAAAYRRATLLAPAAELHRRYAELDKMLNRYTPAPAPQGAL